jgi:hypothetical protein
LNRDFVTDVIAGAGDLSCHLDCNALSITRSIRWRIG